MNEVIASYQTIKEIMKNFVLIACKCLALEKSETIEDFTELFTKIKMLSQILRKILPLVPSHVLILLL